MPVGDDVTISNEPTAAPVTPAESARLDLLTNEGSEEHFMAAMKAARAAAPDAAKVADEAEAGEPAPKEAPKDEAEAAPVEDDKDSSTPDPKPAEDKQDLSPGALAKARRLFNEGKFEEASLAAFGKNIFAADAPEPTTKAWRAVKRNILEADQKVTAAEQRAIQAEQQHQAIQQNIQPVLKALHAYKNGDYAGFLQAMTGETPEAFQRKIISQLHEKPEAAKLDPVAERRLAAIEAERAQERAEAKRLQEENTRLQAKQNEQAWMSSLQTELKADPRFAKVANKPAFINKVFEVQRANYNSRTQTTLETSDAAELVWEELYGDLIPAEGQVGTTTSAPEVKGVNTGRSGLNGASKKTNLSPTQATEASVATRELEGTPEYQERILLEHIRKAKSLQKDPYA